MTEVEKQLERGGYLDQLYEYQVSPDGKFLKGKTRPDLSYQLALDPCFANGVLYGLHTDDFDPGSNLTEFRSHTGALGRGSLQIVFERKTGTIYADVDRFSPYSDVVGFLGHSGEVIGGFFKKLFRRRK